MAKLLELEPELNKVSELTCLDLTGGKKCTASRLDSD